VILSKVYNLHKGGNHEQSAKSKVSEVRRSVISGK